MKVDLVASAVEFTRFSIIYRVTCPLKLTRPCAVLCPEDIFEKDLILKPTFVSEDNMVVIYTPNNVWPSFYQAIFERTLNNLSEYEGEIEYVYNVGNVVGHVFATLPRDKKGRFANHDQLSLF